MIRGVETRQVVGQRSRERERGNRWSAEDGNESIPDGSMTTGDFTFVQTHRIQGKEWLPA